MGIVIPAWGFTNVVHNLTGTPPLVTPGTNFTAGASSADGSSVSVLSALAFDVEYLLIGTAGLTGGGGTDSAALLDVLTDPAGGTSWGSFIDDLIVGYTGVISNSVNVGQWYCFPIFIKSGTSIGVRARTAHSSAITTGQVVMIAFGNPSRPETWWCGQKVESLGINAGSSAGTDVTPGNTGTYGSWTIIGTTTHPWGSVQIGFNGSDTAADALGYHWQIGYGSNKLPGSPTLHYQTNVSEYGHPLGQQIPLWCNIAAGTTMQARATCSGAAEVIDVALYGVY